MEDVLEGSELRFDPPEEQAAGSVAYQLVRVERDGKLVPATDDEVLEVDHILEDDKKDRPSASGKSQEYVPVVPLLSKISSIQSREETRKLDAGSNSEGFSVKLNTRHECIDVKLQKVKQEEKLWLSREEHVHSFNCINVYKQSSDWHSHLLISNSIPGQESAVLSSVGLEGRSVEELPVATETEETLVTDILSCSYPDFPLSEHEVRLDNLTIRELQETFTGIFGRKTSVKDKLWLRRWIAIGLNDSAGFIIKGRKVVTGNSHVGNGCSGSTKNKLDLPSAPQNIGSVEDETKRLLSAPVGQMQAERLFSGKMLRTSTLEKTSKSLNVDISGSKRMRRPTKRYIEELSELETSDCCSQQISPVESSGTGQATERFSFKSDSNANSQCRITRKDFLGGCGVQIPYVLRVRRGRPRTNVVALMSAAFVQRGRRVPGTQRNEHTSGDYLGSCADIVLRPTCGNRRKHHRAWTLSEVVKLVEGVSKYGVGKWSEIKQFAFASHAFRSSIDLKDKWRNLLRACFAQRTTKKRALTSRRPTAAEIPAPILLRVRDLASQSIGFRSATVTRRNGEKSSQGKQ